MFASLRDNNNNNVNRLAKTDIWFEVLKLFLACSSLPIEKHSTAILLGLPEMLNLFYDLILFTN